MAEGGGLLNRYTGQNLYRGFESLPLRQISSKFFQQRELHSIGRSHYMTPFVPELGCLGVTKVSFKADSSFCIAAFASSLAVLM